VETFLFEEVIHGSSSIEDYLQQWICFEGWFSETALSLQQVPEVFD
jgi:hypothetical protein